jgi:putative transposase
LKVLLGAMADADLWLTGVSREYRKLLMVGAVEKSFQSVREDGSSTDRIFRKRMSTAQAECEIARDGEIFVGKMLRYRIRYFTDGPVMGSRSFVARMFTKSRERFGVKRKDGARRMQGAASRLKGVLWSARDLRVRVGREKSVRGKIGEKIVLAGD